MSGRPLYTRMERVSLCVGLLATLALVLYTPLSPSPFCFGSVTFLIGFVAIVDWSHKSSSANFHV